MGNQSVLLCLSAAGRLSALERVRSERFHCIIKLYTVARDQVCRDLPFRGVRSSVKIGGQIKVSLSMRVWEEVKRATMPKTPSRNFGDSHLKHNVAWYVLSKS